MLRRPGPHGRQIASGRAKDVTVTQAFVIKTMAATDIARAVDWAASEGWNPGAGDAACFAATDPEGFTGGWLGQRMIASISVVKYDSRFAFLGFYIVDPAFRGQGHGLALWEKAVQHAGSRLIGLDGVASEQDNSRRSGFELACRNIRYGGAAPQDAPGPGDAGLSIVPLRAVTSRLQRFDRQVLPAPRPAFLRAWIGADGHCALAAIRDGEMAGYAVIRPCRTGHKIGPLFAPDSGVARDLGLAPVFETARMYTGPAPEFDLNRVFGVTSFELGWPCACQGVSDAEGDKSNGSYRSADQGIDHRRAESDCPGVVDL
jgi:GNAT superfamily N-acetyltransferase